MDKLYKELAAIVGQENFFADEATRISCAAGAAFASSSQADLPRAVIRPRNASQLSRLLGVCSREKAPIAIKGIGSSQLTPCADALLIVTNGLDRIYETDRTGKVVHAQAGTLARDLLRTIWQYGLDLPIGNPARLHGTLGGLIATGYAGDFAAKYGSLGSHIIRLGVFASDGKRFDFFSANGLPGQLDSGLPIADIFFGSAGRLGIIEDCYLRLIPRARTFVSTLFLCEGIRAAAQAARDILLAGLEPAAIQIFDSAVTSSLLRASTDEALIMITRDADEGEKFDALRARLHLKETTLGDDVFSRRLAGLYPYLYAQGRRFRIERLAFPASRLMNFLDGLEAIEAECGASSIIFGDPFLARFTVLLDASAPARATADLFALELMLNDALEDENDAAAGRNKWRESHNKGSQILACLRSVMDPAGIIASPASGPEWI